MLFGIILIVFMFGFFILSIWRSVKKRNQNLKNWAQSIPLTNKQQSTIWELWQDFKAKKVPEIDPLSRLTKKDYEYIRKICSADFRPFKFGLANTLRFSQFLSLIERGYNHKQATIIVGMTINLVGRKDLFKKQ